MKRMMLGLVLVGALAGMSGCVSKGQAAVAGPKAAIEQASPSPAKVREVYYS